VATDRLIECCGGLPLALSVVAARLVANPNLSLTAVADELIHTRERLDLFAGDDAATDVRAVFSWSYRILGEQAARLFRLAGMHPGGDIGALAAAHLVGLSPVQARPLLTQLVRAHLLTEQAPGRYAFHDLLRAYAAELALTIDSEHDRKTALCRLLDYYLHTAHAAALALQYSITDLVTPAGADLRGRAEEFTRHEAALAWLVTERPSLIAAVSRARDAGYFTHCWQLARVLQEFLGVQGHWHDLHQVQQIALEAAERAENPAAQAAAHRALAYADTLLGHYQQAENHLQHALHGYRELDDLVHEGYCRHNLSMVYSAQGRQHEALDNERSTLEIFQRAGHLRGEAIALNMIGGELNAIGEHEQALLHGQQALILHRQTEEWQRDSYILDTVADAHYHLGQYQLAQDCYRQAADVCQQIGNRHEEAALLAHLGDAHHAAEEPELARDAWQQALNIVETFDRLGPGLLASDGNKRLPDVEPLRAKLRQLD
jgi:tetratricopeptide (TPR) repeat protein